jgi:hypothetical protein
MHPLIYNVDNGQLLKQLAKNEYPSVVVSALLNPVFLKLKTNEWKTILKNAAKSNSVLIRQAAAQHPSIYNVDKGETLRNLSKNEHSFDVQINAIRHPNLHRIDGGSYMTGLTKRPLHFARKGLARNPHILKIPNGEETMRKLATNEDGNIRRYVASNPAVIEINKGSLLRKLAKTNNKYIQMGAAENPRIHELNQGGVMKELAYSRHLWAEHAATTAPQFHRIYRGATLRDYMQNNKKANFNKSIVARKAQKAKYNPLVMSRLAAVLRAHVGNNLANHFNTVL